MEQKNKRKKKKKWIPRQSESERERESLTNIDGEEGGHVTQVAALEEADWLAAADRSWRRRRRFASKQ